MTNDGLKGEQVATGVHRAADCFMARWHRDLAERSWLRHTASNTKSGGKGQPGDCEAVLIALSTIECRKEMIDRVARYRFDE